MRYELMNFDLGPNPLWREFDVGPYKITLMPDYDEQQPELSSVETRSFPFDGSLQTVSPRVVSQAKAGENSVTAMVECADEPQAVIWANKEKGIYDVCTILSYLTGRNVFLPQDERRYSHVIHGEKVVCGWEVPRAAELAWSNRTNFLSEREKRPLWLYLNLNSVSDAEVKALLGCVALEIIQEADAESMTEPPTPGFQDLIEKLKDDIDRSGISDDDKNRLKSAVGKWGPNSAQEKFKQLLTKYGLVKPGVNGIPLKRVRGIWDMRNQIAHNSEFADPKWINDVEHKRRVEIFIAARIIPALVMDYLNRKFCLMQLDRVKQNSAIITEYIYHGTHESEGVDGVRPKAAYA